jgi:hypothetical protein
LGAELNMATSIVTVPAGGPGASRMLS